AIAQGDWQAAIIDVRNVLQRDPESAEAHLMLARLSLQLGDLNGAEGALGRAIARRADPSKTSELTGELRLMRGQNEELLTQLDGGALALSESAKSMLRGRALIAAGRANEAVEEFQQLLAGDPQSVPARIGLAEALATSGQS